MKQMIFMKQEELSVVGKAILADSGVDCKTCYPDYSEELNEDTLVVQLANGESQVLVLKEWLQALGKFLKVSITTFDVTEVGDFGEGYVFYLKTA